MLEQKKQIRKQIRTLRKQLSAQQQQQAAKSLCERVLKCVSENTARKVALFFSMDGEIGTLDAITALWQAGIEVYLPVIHPFNNKALLFIRYEQNTPMTRSPLGMLEPKLECHRICPITELDILFTPLVAFDSNGNRLGMGGGFYDRTLEHHYKEQRTKPAIIGLAHDCQQVSQVPVEPWDIPLRQIITPSHHHRFM